MWRRRKLLFNIPPGLERPYWQIPQEYMLGQVWAPLYHGYGYYMDARAFVPDPVSLQDIHAKLTEQAYSGLLTTAIFHGLSLAWGTRSSLKLAGTSVLFTELESYWATNVEKSVTFGSSHSVATAVGHILTKYLLTKKRSWFQAIAALIALYQAGEFAWWWQSDSFQAVGHGSVHRIDHVAHIGGMLVGALSAYFV